MKIVHTFIPHGYSEENAPMEKYRTIGMILSCALAKKYYDKVELYTTEEVASYVTSLNIPYTDIKILPYTAQTNAGLFSIPKLYTFMEQTEPFIHIDIDTFLFEPLNEFRFGTTTFSHRDANHINNLSSLQGYYTSYAEPIWDIKDQLPDWYTSVNLGEIPNMNLIVAKNLTEIQEATEQALNIYFKYKAHWDKYPAAAATIEQLGVFAAMRHYGYDVSYYFNKNPSGISVVGNTLVFNTASSHAPQHTEFNTITQVREINNFNYGGYLHTSGYWLRNKDLLTILKRRIVKEGYADVLALIDLY